MTGVGVAGFTLGGGTSFKFSPLILGICVELFCVVRVLMVDKPAWADSRYCNSLRIGDAGWCGKECYGSVRLGSILRSQGMHDDIHLCRPETDRRLCV